MGSALDLLTNARATKGDEKIIALFASEYPDLNVSNAIEQGGNLEGIASYIDSKESQPVEQQAQPVQQPAPQSLSEIQKATQHFGEANVAKARAAGATDENIIASFTGTATPTAAPSPQKKEHTFEDVMNAITTEFGEENIAKAKAAGATDDNLLAAYKSRIESSFGNSVQRDYPESHTAIKNAYERVGRTGVDLDSMLRLISIESRFDPSAVSVNPKTGQKIAYGLGQFTQGTWNGMVSKYGEEYGITRDDILDPEKNAIMTMLHNKDNVDILVRKGIEPTIENVYIMHFAGEGTGAKVLSASDDTVANTIFSDAAVVGNPSLLGSNKTIGELKSIITQRLGRQGSAIRRSAEPESEQTPTPDWVQAAREADYNAPVFGQQQPETTFVGKAKMAGVQAYIRTSDIITNNLQGIARTLEDQGPAKGIADIAKGISFTYDFLRKQTGWNPLNHPESSREAFNEAAKEVADKIGAGEDSPLEVLTQFATEPLYNIFKTWADYTEDTIHPQWRERAEVEMSGSLKDPNTYVQSYLSNVPNSAVAIGSQAAFGGLGNVIGIASVYNSQFDELEDGLISTMKNIGLEADPQLVKDYSNRYAVASSLSEYATDLTGLLPFKITPKKLIARVGFTAMSSLGEGATEYVQTHQQAYFTGMALADAGATPEQVEQASANINADDLRAFVLGAVNGGITMTGSQVLQKVLSNPADEAQAEVNNEIQRQITEEGSDILNTVREERAANVELAATQTEDATVPLTSTEEATQPIAPVTTVPEQERISDQAREPVATPEKTQSGENTIFFTSERKDATDEVNAANFADLQKTLTDAGIEFDIVEGVFEGISEMSLEIKNAGNEEIRLAKQLADSYDQDAILLVNKNNESFMLGRGAEAVPENIGTFKIVTEQPEMDFTKLPDGTFAIVESGDAISTQQVEPIVTEDINKNDQDVILTPQEREDLNIIDQEELSIEETSVIEKELDDSLKDIPKMATSMIKGLGEMFGVNTNDIYVFSDDGVEGASRIVGLDLKKSLNISKVGKRIGMVHRNPENGRTGFYLSSELKNKPFKAISIVAHEFSHVILNAVEDNMTASEKSVLRAAHREWATKVMDGTVGDYKKSIGLMGDSRASDDVNQLMMSDLDVGTLTEFLKYKEWFADNGGNYMLTEKRPSGIIAGAFFDFAQLVKKAIEKVSPNNATTNMVVKEYLDTLVLRQDLILESKTKKTEEKDGEKESKKKERKIPPAPLLKKESIKKEKEGEKGGVKILNIARDKELQTVSELNDIESLSELAGETEFIEVEDAVDKKIDELKLAEDLAAIKKATDEDRIKEIAGKSDQVTVWDAADDRIKELSDIDDLLEEISRTTDIARLEEIGDTSNSRKVLDSVETRLSTLEATVGVEAGKAKAEAESEAEIELIAKKEKLESGDDPLIGGIIGKIENKVELDDLDLTTQTPQSRGRWNKRTAIDIAKWMTNTLNVPKVVVDTLSDNRLLAIKDAIAPYYGVKGMDLAQLFGTGFTALERQILGTSDLKGVSKAKVDLIEKLTSGEKVEVGEYKFAHLKTWIAKGLVDVRDGQLFYGSNPRPGTRNLSDIQGDLISGESGKFVSIEDVGRISDYDDAINIDNFFVINGDRFEGFIVDQEKIDKSPAFQKGLENSIALTGDETGFYSLQEAKNAAGGDQLSSPVIRMIQSAMQNKSLSEFKTAKEAKNYISSLALLEKGMEQVFPTATVTEDVRSNALAKLETLVNGHRISEQDRDIISNMLNSINTLTTFDGGLYKNSPLQNYSFALMDTKNVDDFINAIGGFAFDASLSGNDRALLADRFLSKFGYGQGFDNKKLESDNVRDFFIQEFNNHISNESKSKVAPAGITNKMKKVWTKVYNGLKGISSIDPIAREAINKALIGETQISKETLNVTVLKDPKKHGKSHQYNREIRQTVVEAVANTMIKRDLENASELSIADAQAAMIDGAVRWIETAGLQRFMFRTIKNIKKVGDANWEKAITVLQSAEERNEKANLLTSIEKLWFHKLNPSTITDEAQRRLDALDRTYDIHKMQKGTKTYLQDIDMKLLEGERLTPSELKLYIKSADRIGKMPLADLDNEELAQIEEQLEDIVGEDVRARKEIKELGKLKTKVIHDIVNSSVNLMVSDQGLSTSLTDKESSNILSAHLGIASDKIKSLGLDVLNSETMLDMIGDGGQAIKDLTLQKLFDGSKVLNELIESDAQDVWEIFEDEGFSMDGFSSAQYSGLAGLYHDATNVKKQSFKLSNGQVMTLTPSELVHFLRASRDLDGYRHLVKGGFERWLGRRRVIHFDISAADVTDIWAKSGAYGDLAVSLDEFVDASGKRLNATSIERTGQAMTDDNPMHESLRVAHEAHFESSNYESINDLLQSFSGMKTKPIARVEGASEALIIEGVDIALSRMIHDNAVYTAYGERANDAVHAAEVFAKETAKNNLAPTGVKLKNDIDDELNKKFDNSPTGRMLSTLKGIRTVGILSNRVQSAGLQIFSGPLYLSLADNFAQVAAQIPANIAKTGAQLVAAKGNPEVAYREMFEKNSTVRNRWNSGFLIDTVLGKYAGTAHRMVEGHNADGAAKWLLGKVKIESGMWMIKVADMMGIAQVWELAKADVQASGIYETGSQEYWDAVVAKQDRAIRKTQPTSSNLDKMGLQKAPGLRQLISFASYRAKAFQLMVEGVHNLTRGDRQKGVKQLISLMTVTALATIFKGTIKAGKGDFDEEEEFMGDKMLKYLASNFANSFPEFLPFWGGLYTRIRTGKYGGDLWIAEVAENLHRMGTYLAKGDETYRDGETGYEKAREFAPELATAAGIGLKGVLDNIEILQGMKEKLKGVQDE